MQTPESLIGQRIEVPSLDEQLSAYEARQALLDDEDLEELDPQTATGVYLIVAGVVGVVAAVLVAGSFAGLVVWMS